METSASPESLVTSFHVFRCTSNSDTVAISFLDTKYFLNPRVMTVYRTSGILVSALPESRKVTKMVHKISEENKCGNLHVE